MTSQSPGSECRHPCLGDHAAPRSPPAHGAPGMRPSSRRSADVVQQPLSLINPCPASPTSAALPPPPSPSPLPSLVSPHHKRSSLPPLPHWFSPAEQASRLVFSRLAPPRCSECLPGHRKTCHLGGEVWAFEPGGAGQTCLCRSPAGRTAQLPRPVTPVVWLCLVRPGPGLWLKLSWAQPTAQISQSGLWLFLSLRTSLPIR